MARIVQKFGGTSVGDMERIRRVAARVQREVAAGNEVAVVLSAMAGTTDQLVAWTREASAGADPREFDLVVSTGEQITIGLLAIVLQDMGVAARSWTSWQLPIRTDGAHTKARIENIDTAALEADLERGRVAIVPGFQGISPEGRIATLGRGGSDTSGCTGAALNADRCDILPMSMASICDPRIVAKGASSTDHLRGMLEAPPRAQGLQRAPSNGHEKPWRSRFCPLSRTFRDAVW